MSRFHHFHSKYQQLCQVNFAGLDLTHFDIDIISVVPLPSNSHLKGTGITEKKKNQLSDDAKVVRGDNPRYNLIYPRYPKIQKASFIKIIKGFSTRLHWCRCECAERGFRFRVASASYSVWQDFACSWGGVNEQYEESGGDYSCLVASKSALVSMMCLYYIYIW